MKSQLAVVPYIYVMHYLYKYTRINKMFFFFFFVWGGVGGEAGWYAHTVEGKEGGVGVEKGRANLAKRTTLRVDL